MKLPTVFGVAGLLVIAGAAGAQDALISDLFSVDGGAYQLDQPSERGAAVLYSRIVETSQRFNPGMGGPVGGPPGIQPNVAFDDIPIPAVRLAGNTSVAVSRVTVGVRRLANAPATDLSLFWATATTGAVLPDTELDVPFNAITTVSLAANGPTAITQLVTIGDGSAVLFTALLNNTILGADFPTFLLGMQLSNPDPLNGFRVTAGPDANANVLWGYDTDVTDPESRFNFGAGQPTAALFIEIEGTPVPTPGALALLGLGGLAATRRRR